MDFDYIVKLHKLQYAYNESRLNVFVADDMKLLNIITSECGDVVYSTENECLMIYVCNEWRKL